ncbi:MAG: transcriptional regulator GcvA [Rhodospirillales bacterium]|nr:transcriptional regulator GcvA [Rhodospirillales bacterium]
MPRPLPPLHTLRVFEAAARHRSFTRAAQELAVTQAAVSQQIKGLEADLGRLLFRRLPRRLVLTEAGLELADGVAEALNGLRQTVAKVRRRELAGRLTLTAMPSFAACWLVPRLGRFFAKRPEIELGLHTGAEVIDLRQGAIDVAIRHGAGHYPGLAVEKLALEEVFPVCAPALARRLNRPADILNHVVIQDQGLDWEPWLKAAGLEGARLPPGPTFHDTTLALRAAADGQGITFGRTLVALDLMKTGALVRPFAPAVPAPHGYHFVCLPDRAGEPRVKAFGDWLKAEIAASLAEARELERHDKQNPARGRTRTGR